VLAVNRATTSDSESLRRALLSLGVDEMDENKWQGMRSHPFHAESLALGFKDSFELTVQRGDQKRTLVLFPNRSISLHPTQLYSSIKGLVLFLFLFTYYPLRRRDGEVIALFALLYPVFRFLIEYLRSDEIPLLDGLTISQNVSLVMFAAGLATWLHVRRQPARYPTSPKNGF
jgi:prolipoprotein diacylglyceryltransferase